MDIRTVCGSAERLSSSAPSPLSPSFLSLPHLLLSRYTISLLFRRPAHSLRRACAPPAPLLWKHWISSLHSGHFSERPPCPPCLTGTHCPLFPFTSSPLILLSLSLLLSPQQQIAYLFPSRFVSVTGKSVL